MKTNGSVYIMIIVSDSSTFPLKDCVDFFETLSKKTQGELYNIVINAMAQETDYYQLSYGPTPYLDQYVPQLHIEYHRGKSRNLSVIFITWKVDHWDVRLIPEYNGISSMMDLSIGRTAEGLPTHDC